MGTAVASTRHRALAAESALTGTTAALRLALRRDRIRLAVWLTLLILMMAYTPGALELAYPAEEQRRTRVELMQTPAGIIMGGPMFGRDETALGAMIANELMLSMIVATSILAVLTVIRHTRRDEESGAAELVLSSVVGRHARTAAALILVGGVNALLAGTVTAALVANGFGIADSAALSLGITAVAVVFGVLAAVTAQLWRQARTATGAALGALAVAALLRGIGDVIDNSGSLVSWLSPIAWAQQMRSFVELRWWPLLMLIGLTAALVVTAAVLESRRQYDDGIIGSGDRRRDARPIPNVFALHLMLQRGQLLGWGIGLFVAGLAFGSMTTSLLGAAEHNELLARVLAVSGTDGVYTTMSQFLAAAVGAYVVAAVVRVFSDEQSGLSEQVLAAAVSRWRWLLTSVAAALTGAAALLFCAGLGNGLGAGITVGEPATVWRLTGAALTFLPAMAVLAGVAAFAVALRRPWIGWIAVAFVVTSLYLGALLRLPQWLLDASPIGQTTAPADFPVTALIAMLAAAAAATLLAGSIYRTRDMG